MINTSGILKLIEKLRSADFSDINCLIGFDGFIDEVVHVVKKRIDADSYQRELTLKDYGDRIVKTAGLSSNVEIVTVSQKIGGNGPIMAGALWEYGIKTSYLGALGYPDIDLIFDSLSKKLDEVVSIANPAATDAVEFNDGKIIRCKLSALNEMTYDNIIKRAGVKKLVSLLDSSTLIGFVNWSLLNYANGIYSGILNEVLPKLKNETRSKTMFFDLADPHSKTVDDIKKVLSLICNFGAYYKVVLGLNLSEAIQICNIFDNKYDIDNYSFKSLCACITNNMNIHTVVIHPTDRSCCMTSDGVFYNETGPHCKNPLLTTGAGDNFNAGFALGTAMGFAPELCLLFGMASSGYYVRNMRSGNLSEIIVFLESWAKNNLS